MNINLHYYELTNHYEVVKRKGFDDNGKEIEYYGIKVYLATPILFMYNDKEDGRCSLTIWLPNSLVQREHLATLFYRISRAIDDMAITDNEMEDIK